MALDMVVESCDWSSFCISSLNLSKSRLTELMDSLSSWDTFVSRVDGIVESEVFIVEIFVVISCRNSCWMFLNSLRIDWMDLVICSLMFSSCTEVEELMVGLVMGDTLVVATVCECEGDDCRVMVGLFCEGKFVVRAVR